MAAATAQPIISADSHIPEPPDCYTKYIDPKFREDAPHIIHSESKGDLFIIPGMSKPTSLRPLSAARSPPAELSTFGKRCEGLHRSGWAPTARAVDQQRDGITGEI